jgi:hypothetical protein
MADFPSAIASDGSLLIAANNVASTLNGGISAVATDMTLASTANFPAKGGVTVESEAILYTSNNTAGSVLSGLTRGADSTTAAIHADGTRAAMHMQARHHNASKDEIIAIETKIFGIGTKVYAAEVRSSPISTVVDTAKTVATLSIPSSGLWIIDGAVGWRTQTTTSNFYAGINTSANALPTGDTYSNFGGGQGVIAREGTSISGGLDLGIPLPSHLYTTTAATTLYLVQQSSGANNAFGYIQAVKIANN